MAKVVIYLLEPEMSALQRVAQQEYRSVKAQAALIVRNELIRLGMVRDQTAKNEKEPAESPELGMGGAA